MRGGRSERAAREPPVAEDRRPTRRIGNGYTDQQNTRKNISRAREVVMARIAHFFSALVFAVVQAAPLACAQEFPGRQPIRIIVPFLPGAANDTLARITAAALTPRLGQSVVVENKAGAGSAIGTDYVARA